VQKNLATPCLLYQRNGTTQRQHVRVGRVMPILFSDIWQSKKMRI
jgi:hypothetical protein